MTEKNNSLNPKSPPLSGDTQPSALTPQHRYQLRWLITGGCGFIGTSLIKNLASEGGHFIRVLDNLSIGTRDDLSSVTDFIEIDSSLLSPDSLLTQLVVGDIKEPEICEICARDMDIIVHLAANTGVGPSVADPRKDMEANVLGILNMLEAARSQKVERFVFASSGAPVGEVEPPIHEKLAPKPVSPYGASKLAGEGYCSAYYRTFGVKTVALRFGNVYGPGSTHKSSVVAKFIKQAIGGEQCEIYGDGSQTRDFIYIDDLTEAILKAAMYQEEPGQPDNLLPWGEVFQIATNKEHTVNEVARMLQRILNEKGITMQITHGQTRLGDVRRNYSDTTKAKQILSWQPQTDLSGGLPQTINFFLG